jgi:hypothetical protein
VQFYGQSGKSKMINVLMERISSMSLISSFNAVWLNSWALLQKEMPRRMLEDGKQANPKN